ncbi:glutamate racemase [Kangiella sp. TOML190]|uniref:glutamate racemase n=1 Tax=Kangiella sp. TOML190 TaxID=2931351 RepID=UPI00203B986D|nr:glutamate racemase [Kangiella sp. TOML190]
MSERPIGIFDSGVGGLSILKAVQKQLPNENLLYFADSKYAPYGNLDQTLLKQRCLFIADFFAKNNAKAMVIACNTATALMAEWLRAEYDIPIIAIEPAIKPAAALTNTGKIGVFATEHTLNSERYLLLKQRFAKDITVYESACHGFVEQVEQGALDAPETLALVGRYLNPMLENGIDTLVLGCTHYPFLSPSITTVAGDAPLTIVDNAEAVSIQLNKVIAEKQLLNLASGDNSSSNNSGFYNSGDTVTSSAVMSKLLGKPLNFLHHNNSAQKPYAIDAPDREN